MNNLILSNFRIDFNSVFFPKSLTEKYDNFLFHKNYPFKHITRYIHETIQELTIPGIGLSLVNVTGINNLGNAGPNFNNTNKQGTINLQYPGTASINEIIEATNITITFRNTLINWLYCYEVLQAYYKRKREIEQFQITLTMMDSAELPIFRIKLSDCFINTLPGLSFSYTASFAESKTFDCSFAFNKFDVEFIIPNFDLTKITL